MNDTSLAKLSFLIVVIGIIVLYFISQALEPEEVSISQIDESFIGSAVSVEGLTKNVKITEHVFFDLCDSEACINVVVFESDARRAPNIYKLQDLSPLRVSGRVDLYKGELEIMADEFF